MQSPRRAIFSPWLDALCTGGASLIALVPLVLLPMAPLGGRAKGLFLFLAIFLNWPHFMASYRLLYATRKSILGYRTASLYFPAALALYGVFALATFTTQPIHVNLLLATSGLYLARHYTGQAWGMMASFAYAGGIAFSAGERRLIRGALDLMMVWHLSWAAKQTIGLVSPSLAAPAQTLYGWMTPVAVASLTLGLAGLGLLARRIGRLPPVRVLVPFFALYIWYALLAKDPSAIIVVQSAHALQYLLFPLRIERNRGGQSIAASLGGWTLAGVAVFIGIPALFAVCYGSAGGQGALSDMVGTVLVSAVNVHHYFIDGALYKLRNPEVRRDLFAHLEPARATAAIAA